MAGVAEPYPAATIPIGWEAADGYLLTDTSLTGTFAPTDFDTAALSGITSMNISRGRAGFTSQISAGTATITVDKSRAGITADTPLIGGVIQITAEATGSDIVFTGVVTSAAENTAPQTGVTSITINAVDRLRTLQNYRYVSANSDIPGDTVRTRIIAALGDLPLLPNAISVLDSSANSVGTSGARDILSAITEAVRSDGGEFFYTKEGVFRFISNATLYSSSYYTSEDILITDAGGDYPVDRIDPNQSVDRVFNSITITNAENYTTTRENGASVTNHQRRGLSLSTVNTTASTTDNLAQAYADRYSKLADGWQIVSFSATRGLWPDKVGDLDLFDVCEISSPESVNTVIEKIDHQWRPQTGWLTRWGLNSAMPASAT